MSLRIPGFRRVMVALLMSSLLLITSAILISASEDATALNKRPPKWILNLPAISCNGSSDTNCHRSSPAVADITGDGKLEIIVATNNGQVIVVRHDGSVLWKVDVAPAFGMGGGKQQIASSPAVADIDRDGRMEVVVGVGTIYPSVCTKGGVIVLDHAGRVEPGWPFVAQDFAVPPSGCPDTVYATPALGDLDRDGDLEIVVAGFDKSIYALHHNGQMVAGFPPNSHHYARFGWGQLKGRLADTNWSSPALTDLNGDGYLDVVVGSDEGDFDARWQPVVGNWSCPYRAPLTAGYCGGSIYAFDRFGKQLRSFPRYKYEAIQSSPAIMDIDGNGSNEIFIGTGSWYYNTSADHPTLGFRLYGMDSSGNDLPGWQGGKTTAGYVAASPAIGDITGDGKPNIVVAASDKRLYAWHTNGQPVAGFPMTPRTHRGTVLDGYNVGTSFILADYTGDGKMEIFFRHAWEINIVNGKGQQLTATSLSGSGPTYLTSGTIMNNPAVADLNGDGHLELVVQNSQLIVWDLPSSSAQAAWPMFKNNAARTSVLQPAVRIAPPEFNLMADQRKEMGAVKQVAIVGNQGKYQWQVSSSHPSRITFPYASGATDGLQMVPVYIYVPPGLPLGENHLGYVIVKITQSNGVVKTESIPVKVNVMRQLHQSFLPYAN